MSTFASKDYNPRQPDMAPGLFDGIELHGVRDLNRGTGEELTQCEVDDEHPEFYSVYLHYRPAARCEGVVCVGDFSNLAAAVDYCCELELTYGWPVTHLCTAPTIYEIPAR